MKPIKDCGWVEPDGTCGLPSNLTPECHITACPRLAPFVSDLLAACKAQQKAIEDIIEAWTNYDMLAALDHYLYDDAQSLAIEAIAKAKAKGDQCSA